MTKTTRLSSILLASVMAVSLTACGSGTKETESPAASTDTAAATTNAPAATAAATEKPADEIVKLRIGAQHFDDDTSKPYDYAVAELKKEMPNVELILEPTLQDSGQKIKTQMATGDLPDIIDTSWEIMQIGKKSNNLLTLDDEAETAKFKQDLNNGNEPKLIAPDNHVYGYPYAGIEFIILYYNKKIFADAGVTLPIKTIDQMKDASKKFTAKGIIPLAIFSKEKWIGQALLQGFTTREEPKGFAALNDVTETPASLQLAAKQIEELQAAGLFSKNATNTNYDQASALFYQGKAAMFINGQWEISSSQKNLGDNVDFMNFPAKDEATYESTKFLMNGTGDPSGFSVSSKTAHKEIAVKVAAFMARKYAEYKYTMVGTPIVSIKIDKPVTAQVPAMLTRLATEFIPNVTGYAEVLSSPKVTLAIQDNAQNLLVSGFKTDQFVTNMNKALKDK
ncbi:extracellular solute-binding protein [Paenibacillus psychroresistens]|uniref:Extracellular solute-binding protein n=1 Tax=Paenibacillus psychroresistens TaxID=1778678 RepID=A0A6B8RMH9_9BACL|nr:extracellular solute-binding protein [Paenibacillus psychroresistens]QGQ97239.1 extracellular solute-binding protein [Paenibacillus psychroresistens]